MVQGNGNCVLSLDAENEQKYKWKAINLQTFY